MQDVDTRQGWTDWKVLATTERSQLAVMTVQPGDSEGGGENRHEDSDQWLLVVSGRGEATVEGRRLVLEPGKLVLIEAGERHEVRATGSEPLVTWNVYAGPAY